MAESKQHYKLTYFDIKGLGEPIRLLFAYVDQPFEDVRLKLDDWPKVKPTTPFGQVPVLDFDGKRLTQSAAILRYLGEHFDLMPKSSWDKAKVDELVTAYFDFVPKLQQIRATENEEKKKEIMNQAKNDILMPRFKVYDEYLSHSRSGFFGNDQICWADFFMYNVLDLCKSTFMVNLSPYSHLTQFMKMFAALPQIQQWHAKHPDVKGTSYDFAKMN